MKAKFEYSKDYQEYLILTTTFLILFIIVYFLSLAGSMYLVYWGIKLAIFLFKTVISLFVWILAAGLMLFSIFFLFMLSSYFFQWDKADTKGLLELKEREQPELFLLIRATAKAAGAPMPHRVFLSNEVNAMVWMEVNFLSFIFPVKKNLILGMGLLHGLNQETLKAILGHEFAHFSQKVNRLNPFIHITSGITKNLVHGQSGYSAVTDFMRSNELFYILGMLLLVILGGIQSLLAILQKQIHQFTLRLARDNEFRADYIGCTVAGSDAMKQALLQLKESDTLFQKTLQLIRQAALKNRGTGNLYHLLRHFREHPQSRDQYQLPRISFDDPESTHPQPYERIQRIESYAIPATAPSPLPACDLLVNIEGMERKLTSIFYETNNYKLKTATATALDLDVLQGNYPPPFGDYFKDRYPIVTVTDLESAITPPAHKPQIDESIIALIQEVQLLDQEQSILNQLLAGKEKIKYFSYKEVPYPRNQLEQLIQQIHNEIHEKSRIIKQLDVALITYALPKWSSTQAILLAEITNYLTLLKDYQTTLQKTLLKFQSTKGSTSVDLAVEERKFQRLIKTIQSQLPELWEEIPPNSSIHRSANTDFSYFLGKNNLQAGLERHHLEWEEIYLLLDSKAQALMHEFIDALA